MDVLRQVGIVLGLTLGWLAVASPMDVTPEEREWFDRNCTGVDFGPPQTDADEECVRLYPIICPQPDFSPVWPGCHEVRKEAICYAVDFSPLPEWCDE